MFQVDKSWVTGSVVRSHLSDEEDDEDGDFIDDDEDMVAMDIGRDRESDKIGLPDGEEAHLLATRTTLRFQARPEHFSGPARELALRCESRLHELSWRAERRAALAGPGGKQHLARHEEPRPNLAGKRINHLLLYNLKLHIIVKYCA